MLANRDFVLFLVSRFASGAAVMLLRTAVAWHIYSLTRSAFHLGLVGLVQFLPALGLSLVGGAMADAHDRRRIINLAQLLVLSVGVALYTLTHNGDTTLLSLYAAVFVVSIAGAFEHPARAALLPSLVPRDDFARAVTFAASNQALAFATGPAIGGLIIADFGIAAAYAVFVGLVAVAAVGIMSLRAGAPEPGSRRKPSVAAIKEGLHFVWTRPVVLGCMTLDMFAVVFGGATALLPIYAEEILQVGPRGYGLLTSTLEIGALIMSVLLMVRPPIVNAGRALLLTVVVYGLATIVFGFSRWFPLSLAAYLLVGMADQVSVVLRSTAIQLSTPDELRGRVSSVNAIFIGASNQIGAARAGFVAAATGATFAVVSGGLACLLVVAVVAYRLPQLRRYRID